MADRPGFDHARRQPRQPQQARSRETFEAILEAADVEFGVHGFDVTTSTKIAKTAGVSVGSLYHLFPDKHAIARALADRYLEEAAAIYAAASSGLEGVEQLAAFVSDVVLGLAELHDRHPGFFVVARHGSPSLEDAPSQHVRTAQVAALVDVVAPLAPGVSATEADLVAMFCIDVARALLERMPPPGVGRERHLVEFVNLILAYLSLWIPGLRTHLNRKPPNQNWV